ncbi:MAG: hypothetical protein R3C03_21935 [Pirellulaceae bacterium]
MKRFQGLIRDTWWLWIVLCVAGTFLSIYVSPVFISTFPISLFTFLYFGLIRYDEEGKPREGL